MHAVHRRRERVRNISSLITLGKMGLDAYAAANCINVEWNSANDDINTQISQMQQLIGKQVDAIIIVPVDASTLGPQVQQAKDAGIRTSPSTPGSGDAAALSRVPAPRRRARWGSRDAAAGRPARCHGQVVVLQGPLAPESLLTEADGESSRFGARRAADVVAGDVGADLSAVAWTSMARSPATMSGGARDTAVTLACRHCRGLAHRRGIRRGGRIDGRAKGHVREAGHDVALARGSCRHRQGDVDLRDKGAASLVDLSEAVPMRPGSSPGGAFRTDAVAADLTVGGSVESVVADSLLTFDGYDILVNDAGVVLLDVAETCRGLLGQDHGHQSQVPFSSPSWRTARC